MIVLCYAEACTLLLGLGQSCILGDIVLLVDGWGRTSSFPLLVHIVLSASLPPSNVKLIWLKLRINLVERGAAAHTDISGISDK